MNRAHSPKIEKSVGRPRRNELADVKATGGNPEVRSRLGGSTIDVHDTEIIEVDSSRFILLEKYRAWPKVGVQWSVRGRRGESDFPLATGREERVPTGGESGEDVWNELWDVASQNAHGALNTSSKSSAGRERTSFLGRLFGRSRSE